MGSQQEALAWMMLGIVLAGSAVLQGTAEGLYGIGSATMPGLAQVLPVWRQRRVFLVLDATPFADRAPTVYLGLLSRVLSLAWQVMPAYEQ